MRVFNICFPFSKLMQLSQNDHHNLANNNQYFQLIDKITQQQQQMQQQQATNGKSPLQSSPATQKQNTQMQNHQAQFAKVSKRQSIHKNNLDIVRLSQNAALPSNLANLKRNTDKINYIMYPKNYRKQHLRKMDEES